MVEGDGGDREGVVRVSALLRDVLEIPERAGTEDYVLRLTDSVGAGAVQATLDEIVPSENIYLIRPNQSLIVVGGRIIVGLIGSPSNQAVTVNVNGKQYTAAAGDVIKVAYNDTTPCQVVVQSFDMFKAILHATCSVTAR